MVIEWAVLQAACFNAVLCPETQRRWHWQMCSKSGAAHVSHGRWFFPSCSARTTLVFIWQIKRGHCQKIVLRDTRDVTHINTLNLWVHHASSVSVMKWNLTVDTVTWLCLCLFVCLFIAGLKVIFNRIYFCCSISISVKSYLPMTWFAEAFSVLSFILATSPPQCHKTIFVMMCCNVCVLCCHWCNAGVGHCG